MVAPNHAAIDCHVAHRLYEQQLPAEFVMVHVNSFANETAYRANAAAIHSSPYKVPVAALLGDLQNDIETWLVAKGRPFEGGVIDRGNIQQTLTAARAQAWSRIKVARSLAESSFIFQGQVYQTDLLRVNEAAFLAMQAKLANAAYSETWTLQDNTTKEFDADGIIALAVAMGQHVSQVYATGRQLRVRIADATIEEVNTIGWPV
jgi:hypothetical protein